MHGILCFGDSITFGRGEIPNYSWVWRLRNYFEPKGEHNAVYNLGVSGHNSVDLLKRFDAEATARVRLIRPEDKFLILIAIGQNDSRWTGLPKDNNPYVDEDTFKSNINELINKAKKYKAKLAFIGLFPVNEKFTLPYEDKSFENKRIEAYNNIIKKQCEKNKVLFLNMLEILIKENHIKLTDDGLHPNSKGYDFMFEKIKDFLESNKLL
jgi:lysophospholipase L1-like esterase